MQPTVTVIVPCFNEEATIGALLSAILKQTFPTDRLEVVIADGLSRDRTRDEIARFKSQNPLLRIDVIDNDERTIPSGLNRAIQASSGSIVVRLDAHSIPIPEYVERCVLALEQGLGDNVGGVWTIVPGGSGAIARGIAAAAAHPLGAGDALYRLGGSARAVDTVPFGAFRRELLSKVGGFDERLLTNEDYEFNFRVRQGGGRVWLDPSIRSEYVARRTLPELARQYWRYGFWKFRMLIRHPRSIRWRQALPPIFVLTILGLVALLPFWNSARAGLGLLVALYLAALTLAGADMALQRRDARILPAAWQRWQPCTLHGVGVFFGALCGPSRGMMAESVRTTLRLRPSEHRLLLMIGDLLASAGAVMLALYVWQQYSILRLISLGVRPGRAESLVRIEVPIWFYLLPLGWVLLMSELYDPHAAVSGRRTVRGIAIAATVGFLAYSLAFILNREPSALPRIVVGAFIIFSAILSLIWRLVYVRIYTTSGLSRRVLIVGAGKAGITLAHVYAAANPKPFSLIGFIDDDRRKVHKLFEGFAVVGTSRQLLTIIDQYRVSDLVVAITGEVHGGTFQMLLDAQERGVEIMRMPTVYEEITQRVPIHHLESDWIIRSFVDQSRVSGAYAAIKRILDVIGGLVGCLILLPLWPVIALVTLVDSGVPIMYSQDRVGKGGKRFTIVKFRTMVQDADADGSYKPAVEGDIRVTRFGRFLRRTHLDEFPQFWNVLRGDMSLVGPRAERGQLVVQYQKEIPFYRARLLVKPGLTGWAQINYGYVVDVKETAVKLEYDLYYIIHRSFVMDISVVLRTIGAVLGRKGR